MPRGIADNMMRKGKITSMKLNLKLPTLRKCSGFSYPKGPIWGTIKCFRKREPENNCRCMFILDSFKGQFLLGENFYFLLRS